VPPPLPLSSDLQAVGAKIPVVAKGSPVQALVRSWSAVACVRTSLQPLSAHTSIMPQKYTRRKVHTVALQRAAHSATCDSHHASTQNTEEPTHLRSCRKHLELLHQRLPPHAARRPLRRCSKTQAPGSQWHGTRRNRVLALQRLEPDARFRSLKPAQARPAAPPSGVQREAERNRRCDARAEQPSTTNGKSPQPPSVLSR
jgi:hypothetical protein